jgi:LDH2 family malate/lactate/ureidoglycolate dehydrogenase
VTSVAISELRSLVQTWLEQRYPPHHAEMITDVVMFGELAGRPTHGILRVLPGSFGAMDEEPGGEPVIERPSPVSGLIAGRPGMLVAALATDLLIEIADEHGFAVVATRGSRSTSGSLAYYVERMTRAGLVSFASANTLGVVTVPGSHQRLLGTNPLSFGIPAQGHPFIVDMGTSGVTFGDIVTAATNGVALPEGVAVDAHGDVTTDPNAVRDGGALLPFGGHKGMGLSMMVEVLNRALGGPGIDDDGVLTDWSHVFVGFSVGLMGDGDEVKARAESELRRIASTETVDGSQVRIPGHRGLVARDEALARGTVEVDDDSYARLLELVEAGVS